MLRARVSPLQKRTTLASFQIANRLAKAMAPLAPYGTLESKAFGHQGSKDIHRLIAWQPRWGSNSPWESKQICIGHEWWFSQKIWNMQKDWTPNWLNSSPSCSEKWKLERQLPDFLFEVKTAAVEQELCDFLVDWESVNQLSTTSIPEVFWSQAIVHKNYPILSRIAIKLMTLFGSTYMCESLFSKLTFIKNIYRSTLTNEHTKHLLQLAVSKRAIDYMSLVNEKRFLQVSHWFVYG